MLKFWFLFGVGVGAATSGKLTFMVGGVEEEFTAAKELLSCMGANVVYCGQVGTGQVWLCFHIPQLLLFLLYVRNYELYRIYVMPCFSHCLNRLLRSATTCCWQ